jgi:hypothetical protein
MLTCVYSCVAAAKHGPDPAAAVQNGILNKAWDTVATMAPVKTFVSTPPAEYQPTDTNLFAAQFNGINSMVCKFYLSRSLNRKSSLTALSLDAYSGAVMFVAFLSEMRRPMDFWKGLLVAQTFITVVYIFFGAFVRFQSLSTVDVIDNTNDIPRSTTTTASTATVTSTSPSTPRTSKLSATSFPS